MGKTVAELVIRANEKAGTEEKSGKVAYIGVTKEDKAVGVSREEGFRAGLKSAGVELEEAYTRKAEFTMDSGYHAALDLLGAHPDIQIISVLRIRLRLEPLRRCWLTEKNRFPGLRQRPE